MSFDAKDRRAVESLLGKMTTMSDAVGRMKRDIQLELWLNPQWNMAVRGELEDVVAHLTTYLNNMSDFEQIIASTLYDLVPPA